MVSLQGGRWEAAFPTSVHNCGRHGPEPGQYCSYEVEHLLSVKVIENLAFYLILQYFKALKVATTNFANF